MGFVSNGTVSKNDTYIGVADNFMALGDTVEQDLLNSYEAIIEDVLDSFNSTVFPEMHTYQDIKDWFKGVTFNSSSIESMYR